MSSVVVTYREMFQDKMLYGESSKLSYMGIVRG